MSAEDINKIKSEAALQGWLGGSVESSLEKARAAVELEYHEESRRLRSIVQALEALSDRLLEREASVLAYIDNISAERSLSAPFDWILAKIQLAMLKRKGRRTEQALADARSNLNRLRERADARLALLVSEARSAYYDGGSLRELIGQQSKVGEEEWDELGI